MIITCGTSCKYYLLFFYVLFIAIAYMFMCIDINIAMVISSTYFNTTLTTYHMILYNDLKKLIKGFKLDSDNPILYI